MGPLRLRSLDVFSMQRFISLLILSAACFVTGCAANQEKLVWRAKDLVFSQTPTVRLLGTDERVVLSLPTKTLQQLMLAHLRINRAAKIQTELLLVEGDQPNAFAAIEKGQRVIGINLAMMKLIGDDIQEYAALIGHEAAHWAKGHVDSSQLRGNTLNALGTLVGAGLGMAGVPAAGAITTLGIELIDATYSREQEREADAQSIQYLEATGYDPRGSVRLHEKLLSVNRGYRLPFLSSHPSGEERIANLKAQIEQAEAERRNAVSDASKTAAPIQK